MANALYAQAGGVTAVINASACGVVETCRAHSAQIGAVYGGLDGIVGVLAEELIDLAAESAETIAGLRYTPGGAFGTCRFDLGTPESHPHQYHRLMEVFQAHDIRYFFYNGGGGSMLTAHKVAQYCEAHGFPVTCVGVPKTMDNDLPLTDCSPGFGSTAKFIATAVREVGYDVASMATTSTKVFILEVMGRHTGWVAAASALAAECPDDPPHVILFAERAFDAERFLAKVQAVIDRVGYCVVVAAEGLLDADGQFVAVAQTSKTYGHEQLGGVAMYLAGLVKQRFGHKTHWSNADYLQRAARHIGSRTDVEQAYAVGRHAVELALDGHHSVMPVIRRIADAPYQWALGHVSLSEVADVEMPVPEHFIDEEGFNVTEAARRYLLPLIAGEDYPPMCNGLPSFVRLKRQLVAKKLAVYDWRADKG